MKIIKLFTAILTILFTFSCKGVSEDPNTIDVVPHLNSTSWTRSVVSVETTGSELEYYYFAPLLHSFDSNTQGVINGGSYTETVPLFGTVTISVTEENGLYVFTGTNDDDSLRLEIIYNPVDRTFDYYQTSFIEVPEKVIDDTSSSTDIVMVMPGHISYQNVTIAEDGGFNSLGTVIAFQVAVAAPSEIYVIVSDDQEIYYGELAPSMTGVGVSIYGGYDGDPCSYSDLPASSFKPAGYNELSDISKMDSYFKDAALSDFKNISTISGAPDKYSSIYVNDSTGISDYGEGLAQPVTLQELLAAYPATWGANSIRNNP